MQRTKVVATATGFDGVVVRVEGDVFDCPKNAKGEEIIPKQQADGTFKPSWYKLAEAPKASGASGKKDGRDLA